MPEETVAAAATEGGEGAAEEGKTLTPAERTTVEPTSSAPDGQRPGIESLWAESAKEEDESGSDEGDGKPEAVPAEPAKPARAAKPAAKVEATPEAVAPAASPEALAKLEGKTEDEVAALAAASADDLARITAFEANKAEAAEAAKLKTDLDEMLASFEDPATLNAALEKAGVDKIAELPAVKALIGRIRQSAVDSTKAEIQKAQQEAAQLAGVTEKGRAAKGKLVDALDKLATDIEAGEEALNIPTADSIKEAFDEYAGAAVGEYHTRAWNVLADQLYSLPEMGGTVPEGVKTQPPAFNEAQVNLLNAVKNEAPATWLAAHLAVERDVLWTWAQQEAAAANAGGFENEKVLLQAGHAKEIAKLTREHTAAIASAREEARAEALADRTKTPKTPVSTKPTTLANEVVGDDDIPAGASIGEIRKILKARSDAGIEV